MSGTWDGAGAAWTLVSKRREAPGDRWVPRSVGPRGEVIPAGESHGPCPQGHLPGPSAPAGCCPRMGRPRVAQLVGSSSPGHAGGDQPSSQLGKLRPSLEEDTLPTCPGASELHSHEGARLVFLPIVSVAVKQTQFTMLSATGAHTAPSAPRDGPRARPWVLPPSRPRGLVTPATWALLGCNSARPRCPQAPPPGAPLCTASCSRRLARRPRPGPPSHPCTVALHSWVDGADRPACPHPEWRGPGSHCSAGSPSSPHTSLQSRRS